MKWIVWIALVACACGKSKQDCKRQVDDLMKLLHAIDHTGSLFMIDDDMHLVERTDLPRADFVQAPVVVIKASLIEYQGALIGDVTELRGKLADAYRKIQEDVDLGRVPRHWTWDHRIYFEIDAAAKWGTIASAVDAAGELGFVPHFVFSLPVTWQKPPRAPIDDELDRLMHEEASGNKATEFAKLASDQIKSCPAMSKVFGAVGSEEGGDKAAELIEGIGPALIDCNCDVDIPNFRSTMYRLLANEHPTVDLAVAVTHDAPPFALPATATWKDAASQLPKTAWLAVK